MKLQSTFNKLSVKVCGQELFVKQWNLKERTEAFKAFDMTDLHLKNLQWVKSSLYDSENNKLEIDEETFFNLSCDDVELLVKAVNDVNGLTEKLEDAKKN